MSSKKMKPLVYLEPKLKIRIKDVSKPKSFLVAFQNLSLNSFRFHLKPVNFRQKQISR